MKNGRIVIGIDIQPWATTPQLKCFDFSTLSIQSLDTAGAVTKEQISKYTPSSDAHKIYTMLYKIKVPCRGHQVYTYYISDTRGHLKYVTTDAIVNLRLAGHIFSNFSLRNNQIVYGIKHEIQELTVQDLLQEIYGTGSNTREFALDLTRIPREIKNITFNAPDAPHKPNLTVGSAPSSASAHKLAFKGNWGSIQLGVVQSMAGERALEIENVECLFGATAFRNIKINSVKKISHCFNSEYIGDNNYTFQMNNPAIQEIEYSFDGIKGAGLPIEAILSKVEVLINSFNGYKYIPSNIIFSAKAIKIENSLRSNTLDKRPLSLTATSSSTSIKTDRNTETLEGVTISIPILSETNILTVGECIITYQEPKTPEEERLKKVMERLVKLSNQPQVYSPGAIISNYKQLEIARSLILSPTNHPITIETRKVYGNAVPAEQVLLVLPDKTKLIVSISNGQKYQKPPCFAKIHNDILTITNEHKLYKFRAGASDIAKAITWAIENNQSNIVLPLLDCIDT